MIGAGFQRRAFAVALAIGGLFAGYRPRLSFGQATAMQTIHAGKDWYRERPEREETWQGELSPREAPLGPAGRPALRYALRTAEGEIAIYDPTNSPALRQLAGEMVVVHGKLVDLEAEGAGKELWIGEIAAAAN